MGAGDAGAGGGAGDMGGAAGDVDAEVFFATVILIFFFSRAATATATAIAGRAITSGFAIAAGDLGL